MSNGSESFTLFKCLDGTKFVFFSVFSLKEKICGKKNGQIGAPRLQKRHIRLKCVAQKTSYVLKNFLL